MANIQVWQEAPQLIEDQVELAATLEIPHHPQAKLWYRVPQSYQAHLTDSADPFVIATLLLGMTYSWSLKVEGGVSPSLLRNLEDFQDAWCCWPLKRYQKVEIQAAQGDGSFENSC